MTITADATIAAKPEDTFTDSADEARMRVAAMKFYAMGRTAAGLRAGAADVDDLAPAGIKETMLALADDIDELAAEGPDPGGVLRAMRP